MSRKSQITLFLLIGLVLIIVIGIVYYNSSQTNYSKLTSQDSVYNLNKESEKIKSYIEKCLLDVASRGIFTKIGPQGGYIDPEYNEFYGDYDQVNYKTHGPFKVPYWYYNGMDISPSKEQVERRLGRFILVEMNNCTENLGDLTNLEISWPRIDYEDIFFDLSKEDVSINVSINRNEVSILYIFPIELNIEESKKTIREFFVRIPVPLGRNFDIAKKLLKNIISSDEKGYNIRDDCSDYNPDGYNNVITYNNMVRIIDYETFYNNFYTSTFIFQYLYNDKIIYGTCTG